MERRKLGRTDIAIAPLVLGGNVFGWVADKEDSFALLDRFVDAGFNAVDTADVYSAWVPGHLGGESETVIGGWLKARGRRDQIILATKVGAKPAPGTSKYDVNLSASHIVAAIENSLQRLQTDYIDLYQAHTVDAETPLDETLEAFDQLIKAGKVRAIGASNYSRSHLSEALKVSRERNLPRYQSLQPLYNLYDRSNFEENLRDICIENDVGVISLTSLAKGFLTGKYSTEDAISRSQWTDRLNRYQNERGHRILTALKSVADELNATQAQVALAWVIAQPGITAPIVAADNVEQLNEIMGAVNISLDDHQLDMLSIASAA